MSRMITIDEPCSVPSIFSELRVLSVSSIPLTLRGVVISAQSFFKSYILAQKDESLLAIYSSLSALESFIFAFTFGSLAVITPLVSRYRESTPEKAGVVLTQGFVFAGTALIMPVSMLCFFAPNIFKIMQQPEVVVQNSRNYFLYALAAYIMDIFYRLLVRVKIGFGDTTSPLFFDSIEACFDIVFTYWFVVHKEMGVSGCALAYALAAAITFLLYAAYLSTQSHLKKYELFYFHRDCFSAEEFKKIFIHGLQLGFSGSVETISQALTVFFCGFSGLGALIGIQAASTISSMIDLPIGGVSEVSTALIGELFAKNDLRYRRIGHLTLMMHGMYGVVSFLVLLAYRDFIANLFAKPAAENNYFSIVKDFILIQSVIELFNLTRCAAWHALSGCLKTQYVSITSIAFIFIVNAALASLVQFVFNASPSNMYATQIVGYFLSAAVLVERWYDYEKANNQRSFCCAFSFWKQSMTPARRKANKDDPGVEMVELPADSRALPANQQHVAIPI